MEIINENGNSQNQNRTNQESKRVIAGILGILIGCFGIHKFVLGYNKEGFIMIGIGVITCGIGFGITSLIGLIEGIIYLTKSDQEFIEIYQNNQKPWF